MWDGVCKGKLYGKKAFYQGMSQDGPEAFLVHDNVVKNEIPAKGLGLACWRHYLRGAAVPDPAVSVPAAQTDLLTVRVLSGAGGVGTKVLVLSVLWTHLEVQVLVWPLASSQGRQPQSLTLHRDLFSLSLLKAEMELQMTSMLSVSLQAGKQQSLTWLSCSQLHRELFLLSTSKAELLWFPREATGCRVKVEHLKF